MRRKVGPVESMRAGVVERLRAREGELVEAIFARVQGGAFAGSGDGDAEYLAGLRAAVVVAVEYGLEGVERGEEWVGPIPVAMVEQARRAAQAGVSLEVVLRRYVVGHTLLAEFVVEEVDRGGFAGERGALRGLLGTLASVLDRLLSAITGEYGDELARASRSPEQRRAERVRRLLDGGGVQGSDLDYDFGGWHLGVIAAGGGALRVVQGLAAAVDRRLLSVAQGPERVWAWLGGRERFAVGDLERILGHEVVSDGLVLALGEPAQGIEGWRMTHRQAQAALLVALRRPQRLTRYVDVALLASVLKDELLASTLIDTYLSPLENAHKGSEVLPETLRAYLAAECQASSAAAVLGVDRKTVEKRLRSIEQRLDRTLHPCPAELEVALALDKLDLGTGPEISTVG